MRYGDRRVEVHSSALFSSRGVKCKKKKRKGPSAPVPKQELAADRRVVRPRNILNGPVAKIGHAYDRSVKK